MTMRMKDDKWLTKKAAEEDGQCVSVGGIVSELAEMRVPQEESRTAQKLAFARLIELSRRGLRFSVEELAGKADVDVSELVGIEEGKCDPEPRTIFKLAAVLRVPQEKLLELSGLTKARDRRLNDAAIRFAARSERMDELSTEEETALREFVKILAESSEEK